MTALRCLLSLYIGLAEKYPKMFYIISLLVIAAVVTAVLRRFISGEDASGRAAAHETCTSCSGGTDACMHKCLLDAAVEDVEYYDDEELDMFKGRHADKYSDEEAEQFRYVMSTMQPGEVAGWCRSLSLRGIELPNQVKDEAVLLMQG